MRKLLSMLFLLTSAMQLNAQVVSGLRPSETAKFGEYTEWQKKEVVFDDQTKAEIEYRITLVKRKGIACHYAVEIKNNSDMKLTVVIKSSYYDKLVKGNYGEQTKETIKPGKSVTATTIAQGCKKEKGTDADDYGICMACEFGVSIYVSK